MFKSLAILALAGTISLATAQTTCFQCVNAKKFWEESTPACVAATTATTYDTLEECSENDAFAAGARIVTIDSNFDFLSNAAIVELDMAKTNEEISVVFNQDLNINYAYKMSDNGV